jgi:tRNA threonylcarbamoyladenosine biosynthesis protein TsaE
MQIVSTSVEQTMALGQLLGQLAPAGACIALHGHLGAGKTHLTRGIALGAAVDDPTLVSSPTYVLLNIYPGPRPVFHMDAYRVASEEDFAAVGFEELLQSNGIAVVEWAEKVAAFLPADRLEIVMEAGEGEEERLLTLSATGRESERWLEAVMPLARHQRMQSDSSEGRDTGPTGARTE